MPQRSALVLLAVALAACSHSAPHRTDPCAEVKKSMTAAITEAKAAEQQANTDPAARDRAILTRRVTINIVLQNPSCYSVTDRASAQAELDRLNGR